MSSASELAIDNTTYALSLAENIFGNGVSGLGATITGSQMLRTK